MNYKIKSRSPPAALTGDKRLLSVSETYSILGIKRTHFYKLINRGQIKAVRIGRRTLVSSEEISRFIEALPIAVPSKKFGK